MTSEDAVAPNGLPDEVDGAPEEELPDERPAAKPYHPASVSVLEKDFGQATVLGRRKIRCTEPMTLSELLG